MKLNCHYKNLSISKEVKASTAYTICSILVKGISLITLPIFTRIMSTDDYGLITVYESTANVVIVFISLQLPYGSLSTAMIKFKNDREGYLSTLCMISICLTLIYFIMCLLLRNYLVRWFNIPFFLLIIMGIEMLFVTIRTAWMGWQRFEYKYKNVVIVTLVTTVVSVIISLMVVLNSNDKGVAKILSTAFVSVIIGLSLFCILICKGKKTFNKEYWKYALSFNVPLIPYYLSQVIFNQSDRLMIDHYCGRNNVAIYGVAYSLATILTFVVTSIHNSYTPWIFERIDKNELRDNRRISIILSSGIAFGLLGIIATTPEIIMIVAGKQYMPAIWVVLPVGMSVLLLFYADLFDCILFFYESKVFLTLAAIISALANIFLNYIFIPKFGFMAAAYTTLASYLILAILDYIFMLKICEKNDIDKKIYDIKGLIVVFIIYAVLGLGFMSLYNYPVIRYLIIVAIFILSLIFRKKLIEFFKLIKRDVYD